MYSLVKILTLSLFLIGSATAVVQQTNPTKMPQGTPLE